MTGRAHEDWLAGIAQEVAGDLFNRKPIERFVGVERFDHEITKSPDGARRIIGITRRIRIAHQVQPHPRPMLAITFLLEQSID